MTEVFEVPEKKKKPFYKKWWVWLIAILILFGMIGNCGSDPADEVLETSSQKVAVVDEVESVEEEVVIEEVTTPTPEPTETPTPTPDVPLGKRNALGAAKDYLAYTAFSKQGLTDQLEYEGYTKEECEYGVENCNADWNEQALLGAIDYLNYSAFSKKGLIDQLKYEGYTSDQAGYGVSCY